MSKVADVAVVLYVPGIIEGRERFDIAFFEELFHHVRDIDRMDTEEAGDLADGALAVGEQVDLSLAPVIQLFDSVGMDFFGECGGRGSFQRCTRAEHRYADRSKLCLEDGTA